MNNPQKGVFYNMLHVMNDPLLLATLVYKNISSTSNDIKLRENIQTLIYTFKYTVIQSKSIRYCK